MIVVRQLIWDDWNIAHIARHQIIPRQVEQVCYGSVMTSETYGGRLRLVGPTDAGEVLTIILSPEELEGAYYPVTARPASRKERRLYAEASGGGQS